MQNETGVSEAQFFSTDLWKHELIPFMSRLSLDTSFIKEHLENKYSFFIIFPEDPFDIQMIPTITLIDFMMLLLFVNCAICSEWLMAF